jgi:hypothetical protein
MTTNDDVFAAMDKALGAIKYDEGYGKDISAQVYSVDGGRTFMSQAEWLEWLRKHDAPTEKQGQK